MAVNENFAVYVYLHPKESGQEKWHVHIVRRSDGSDAKICLWTFELIRQTVFDRPTIKEFIRWVYENRHYLRRKWVQNVLKPFYESLGRRNKDEDT